MLRHFGGPVVTDAVPRGSGPGQDEPHGLLAAGRKREIDGRRRAGPVRRVLGQRRGNLRPKPLRRRRARRRAPHTSSLLRRRCRRRQPRSRSRPDWPVTSVRSPRTDCRERRGPRTPSATNRFVPASFGSGPGKEKAIVPACGVLPRVSQVDLEHGGRHHRCLQSPGRNGDHARSPTCTGASVSNSRSATG